MSQVNEQYNSINEQPHRNYWRSLEEYAGWNSLRNNLDDEFPYYEPKAMLQISRRRFMQLSAAAMAMAGFTLSGCRRWPEEKIVPFTVRPDAYLPGSSSTYATIIDHAGIAIGLLVSQVDGRPIKIEGNPRHPFSLGASNVFSQASILELYDPNRSQSVITGKGNNRLQASWEHFRKFAHDHFSNLQDNGRSIAVLSEPSASPSLKEMKNRLLRTYPGARWYQYEPISCDNQVEGMKLACGKSLRPEYHLDQAKIIACLDCDLLGIHPASTRYARDWADGRSPADPANMNRLYVLEPSFSITGSVADYRLPLTSSQIRRYLNELAGILGFINSDEQSAEPFIHRLAEDLYKYPGRSILCAGWQQSAEVHALVWAINYKLGNIGKTVTFTEEPLYQESSCCRNIIELTRRINRGEITTLILLGGNPVYDAPADLNFAEAIEQVQHTIRLGMYEDETSKKCTWHLPRAHYLECWGDGEAWNGTFSVQQPLIMPLFDGKSPIELLAIILNDDISEGYQIIRRTFRANLAINGLFEKSWRHVLHEGLIIHSEYTTIESVQFEAKAIPTDNSNHHDVSQFEVQFIPSNAVYDGRYANNAWLQELPDPLTKVTWNNPARINIKDAEKFDLKNGDLIRIQAGDRRIELPVYLMPGQAEGCISLVLGYGRTSAGDIGNQVGTNVYPLRTTAVLTGTLSASIEKIGRTVELATTQNHHLIDRVGQWAREERIGKQGYSGRIIKETLLKHYSLDPHFIKHDKTHGSHHSLSLWNSPHDYNEPHAWGMVIDMNTCIGCNACVVACQAENNISVAGEDQIRMHREMHWLRIDRYFKGDPTGSPHVAWQPMMCNHCENAPCEQVCPVAATVHDTEGLNTMVYNRCIGTRYCSNNCPYKVRRFNYFDYHSKDPRQVAKPWPGIPDTQQKNSVDSLKQMVYNPEVTVRMRGVMEKCTFCVQRIAKAKIQTKNDFIQGNRITDLVQEGEIQTACQQACPTQAIVFGNLNDPNSKVARLHRSNRAYAVLEELNLRSRTRYLAKIRNTDELT